MSVLSVKKPTVTPLPVVFDSPHSGREYPDDFGYACDFGVLQAAEDHYVDDLFADAPQIGAHLLLAHFPRSYIDVNRHDSDVDTKLLDGPWDHDFAIAPTSRSAAGIGLIRRLVKPGIAVYDRSLSSTEIMHRIDTYYRPYHTQLADLIEDAHYNFGQAWHINCHSMPASSAYPKRPIGLIGNKPSPADFVLGDRDATTCDPAFTRALRDFITDLGYKVAINDPFKGVELVKKYSNPAMGYHSIQIEINKALYLNEKTGERNANYDRLKADIVAMNGFIAAYVGERLVQMAAD